MHLFLLLDCTFDPAWKLEFTWCLAQFQPKRESSANKMCLDVHSQGAFRWSCGRIFNGFLCLHLTLHLLPCSLVRVTTLQLVLAHSPCGFHVGLLRHASPLQPGQPSASGFTCRHCLDDGLVRCTVWSKTHPNRGLNPYQTNLCPPSSHLFI